MNFNFTTMEDTIKNQFKSINKCDAFEEDYFNSYTWTGI